MPAPINPRLRAAIIRDIKAGKPRNTIARNRHVSGSTVTKIARDEGLANAFDRSQTVKGTRAKQIDAKARRAALEIELLDDAERLRQRAWEEYTQIVGGPAGAELVTTKLPPLRDQQSAYTSIAICIDKSAKLTEQVGGDGVAHARSLLGQLGEALQVAAGALPADSGTTPDPDPGNGA